jgi:uncharacterized membrane protein YdbT with pleckstrin-like domain
MTTLEPGEKIYLIKRQHRIVLILSLLPQLLIFLLIIILIISAFFLPLPTTSNWLIEVSPGFSNLNVRHLALFFLSLFLPFFWEAMFLIVVNYYLNCWVVTNERIISNELRGLFNLKESVITFDKIQDVTVDIKGFLATVFGFGDVTIETAGELGDFIFHQIPDPDKTKDIIFRVQREFLKNQQKNEVPQRTEK